MRGLQNFQMYPASGESDVMMTGHVVSARDLRGTMKDRAHLSATAVATVASATRGGHLEDQSPRVRAKVRTGAGELRDDEYQGSYMKPGLRRGVG